MQCHLHKTIKRQFGIGYNQLRGDDFHCLTVFIGQQKKDFLLHVANFLPIIFIPYFPSPPRNIMLQFAFGSSRFQWTDTKGWVREQKKADDELTQLLDSAWYFHNSQIMHIRKCQNSQGWQNRHHFFYNGKRKKWQKKVRKSLRLT